MPKDPDMGIFRFFLLLVFSNESYPSTESPEEIAETGIEGLRCLPSSPLLVPWLLRDGIILAELFCRQLLLRPSTPNTSSIPLES